MDVVQEIIQNEIVNQPSSTAAETATTETTAQETTTTETAASGSEVVEEVIDDSGSELVEITETPTEETAKTDEKATVETTTQTPSFEEMLNQKLGIKTVDEALKWKQEAEELKQLKGQNTLGSLIDQLSKQGVDAETVVRFHKLDVNALDAKGAIDWKYQMKYPMLTAEQREALMVREYGDENDIAGQAKLMIDGESAKKELAEQKANVLNVTSKAEDFEAVKQKEFQESEQKRITEWQSTPKVKDVVNSLSKIKQNLSFSTFGEDKPVNKKFEFSYNIPEADKAQIEESLRVLAVQQGFNPADPESFNQLQAMAENLYWITNKEKVLNSLANTIASNFHKETAKRFNNARSSGSQNVSIATGTNQTGKDARLEATISQL